MPLIPDDINELFDANIDAKSGRQTLIIPGSSFAPANFASFPTSTAGGFQHDDINAIGSIELPVGAIITAIRVFIRDGAAPVKLLAMFKVYDSTGASSLSLSTSDSAGDGSAQTLTITPTSPGTMVSSGHSYDVQVLRDGPNTGACHIYSAEIDWYKP
jgi:hypothetical protein